MDYSTKRVVDAKRRAERLVPTPWDRNAFLDAISTHRGRPIRLVPMASAVLNGLPCGIWLVFGDHDEILYDESTSEYHVDQTVLHEVGHMMLEHTACHAESSSLTRFLPDLDVRAAQSIMTRTNFDDSQESEAELFADMLMSSAVSKFRRSDPMSSFWD